MIYTAFKPLHDTLARLRLLVHLVDDNVTLTAVEEQELFLWLRDLTALAVDQALEVEKVTGAAAREGA